MYDFRPCARFGYDGESPSLREKTRVPGRRASKDLAIAALVISAAFVARLIEIGLWAILFVLCEEFQELGTAYYHSAVNYRTSGYGDLLLPPGVALAGIAGGNERSRHVRCLGCNSLCRCTAVSSGQVWDLRR
jgi:hypothetical protein